MILEKGNMWSVFFDTDVFMITTNPIRRKDGAVVMGRGIALEAKNRYPTLPYDFGIQLDTLHPEIDYFNTGFIGKYEETPIWWFMVKDHWASKARLDIIERSVLEVAHVWKWDNKRIDLNFPGIGNGGLSKEEVLPIISELPDNVHVWEKE